MFDLDGTLVDTIDLLLQSMRFAFDERRGPCPTTEEWIAGIGTPLETQLRAFSTDDSDLARLTDRYRTYQRAHHDALTRCYGGALETVALLSARGHPLAIVTSKGNEIAHRTVTHVGLSPFVSVIIGVESTMRHKPDPEPVRVALERLGAPPGEAFFIGDSPHDIVAGNAAGVTTVAALWGAFSRAALDLAGPTHVLEQIGDLPALIHGGGAQSAGYSNDSTGPGISIP